MCHIWEKWVGGDREARVHHIHRQVASPQQSSPPPHPLPHPPPHPPPDPRHPPHPHRRRFRCRASPEIGGRLEETWKRQRCPDRNNGWCIWEGWEFCDFGQHGCLSLCFRIFVCVVFFHFSRISHSPRASAALFFLFFFIFSVVFLFFVVFLCFCVLSGNLSQTSSAASSLEISVRRLFFFRFVLFFFSRISHTPRARPPPLRAPSAACPPRARSRRPSRCSRAPPARSEEATRVVK